MTRNLKSIRLPDIQYIHFNINDRLGRPIFLIYGNSYTYSLIIQINYEILKLFFAKKGRHTHIYINDRLGRPIFIQYSNSYTQA